MAKQLTPLIFLLLFSCADPAAQQGYRIDSTVSPPAAYPDSLGDADYEQLENLSCDQLDDTAVIIQLAHEAQENDFPTLETSNFFIRRGHYTHPDSTEVFVWMEGYAGGACGTNCNLMVLFTCSTPVRMITSDNCGVVMPDDIRDLNGDGVLDIRASGGAVWMGEEHENNEIFCFAGGKKQLLYRSQSYQSVTEGWGDNYPGLKNGDTIGMTVHDSLIDNGSGIFSVMCSREIQLYNGGKTVKDILQNQEVHYDTAQVALKQH